MPVRALEAALRQNSIAVADAFGVARDAMHVRIVIGVARPDLVDRTAVAAVLPYGTAEVIVEEGSMNVEQRPLKRIILEMGTGIDLHRQDYTKAAKRAVQDAIYHSSLTLFASLGLDPGRMQIELSLAAQEPEMIDLAAVADILPFGHVTPKAVKGGLNVLDETSGRPCVMVNAAVIVRLPL